MGYQVEEKDSKEVFTIMCIGCTQYISAYTLEEAQQICLDKGYIII